MPTLDKRNDELDLSGEFDSVITENPDEMEEIPEEPTDMATDILGDLASMDNSIDDDEDEEDEEGEEDLDEAPSDSDSDTPREEQEAESGSEREGSDRASRKPRRSTTRRSTGTSGRNATTRPSNKIHINRATAARLYREDREEYQGVATSVMTFLSNVKDGRIIEGVVAGTIIENKEVCWTCFFDGDITVRIPYEESYTQLSQNLLLDNRNQTLKNQNRLMSNSVGIKIPFIVESFVKDPEGDGYIAYASRRAAMRRIKAQHFGANPSRPVLVGENVYAQLIGVGPNKVWLTAYGMDLQLPKRRLSHRYIDDASADFYAGQEILMRVTSVVNKPGNHSLDLSALPIEAEKYKGNLKRIRANGKNAPRFGGTVTSVVRHTSRETGLPKVIVRVWLENGVNVPGFTSTNRLYLQDKLKSGDVVLFEAHGITENGYAYGSIIKRLRRR